MGTASSHIKTSRGRILNALKLRKAQKQEGSLNRHGGETDLLILARRGHLVDVNVPVRVIVLMPKSPCSVVHLHTPHAPSQFEQRLLNRAPA